MSTIQQQCSECATVMILDKRDFDLYNVDPLVCNACYPKIFSCKNCENEVTRGQFYKCDQCDKKICEWCVYGNDSINTCKQCDAIINKSA